jgi:hypothetical protein
MPPNKVRIERIEGNRMRQNTFHKRKLGLIKKAIELTVKSSLVISLLRCSSHKSPRMRGIRDESLQNVLTGVALQVMCDCDCAVILRSAPTTTCQEGRLMAYCNKDVGTMLDEVGGTLKTMKNFTNNDYSRFTKDQSAIAQVEQAIAAHPGTAHSALAPSPALAHEQNSEHSWPLAAIPVDDDEEEEDQGHSDDLGDRGEFSQGAMATVAAEEAAELRSRVKSLEEELARLRHPHPPHHHAPPPCMPVGSGSRSSARRNSAGPRTLPPPIATCFTAPAGSKRNVPVTPQLPTPSSRSPTQSPESLVASTMYKASTSFKRGRVGGQEPPCGEAVREERSACVEPAQDDETRQPAGRQEEQRQEEEQQQQQREQRQEEQQELQAQKSTSVQHAVTQQQQQQQQQQQSRYTSSTTAYSSSGDMTNNAYIISSNSNSGQDDTSLLTTALMNLCSPSGGRAGAGGIYDSSPMGRSIASSMMMVSPTTLVAPTSGILQPLYTLGGQGRQESTAGLPSFDSACAEFGREQSWSQFDGLLQGPLSSGGGIAHIKPTPWSPSEGFSSRNFASVAATATIASHETPSNA